MTTSQVRKTQAAAPTGVSVNAVAGGGSFAAVQQFYKITATGAFGESIASSEVNATPAAGGHIDVTWTGVPAGTTGINVYRGTVTNTENVLVFRVGPGPGTVTDAGGAGVAGTPPTTAAWGSITKTGAVPAKSNVPAGTPSGLAQALVESMSDWCAAGGATATTAGVGPVTLIGKKVAAAAGFGLQEV